MGLILWTRTNEYITICPNAWSLLGSFIWKDKVVYHCRWVWTTAYQVMPMLCIPKKNGKLCTVFDLQLHNNNMVKDVTPFLDQDNTWHNVTCVCYWSKLNMLEAYEQIWVRITDVSKMAFAIVLGTFVSKWCSEVIVMHPLHFNILWHW